jgi:hypothetical protein
MFEGTSAMLRARSLCLSVVFALAACSGTGAPAAKDAPKTDTKTEAKAAEAPANQDLPVAEELLKQVVEASGGKDKFDAVKSYAYEFKMEIPGSGMGGTGKAWYKEGDFYLEIAMPGVGTSYAGSKGGKPWTLDPIQGLRSLTGKEADMTLMGSSLNIAADWREYFDDAETTGVEEVGGKKFAEVKLSKRESGAFVTLRIDLADKRVIGRKVLQPSPMGEMPVEETLEDYREQDGMWFSFRQIADMKLQKMQTQVTKLELNVPVDESKFAVPGTEPPPETKAGETKAEAPADKKGAKKDAGGDAKGDPLASGK